MEKIKIADIIPFTEKDRDKIVDTITKLTELSKVYREIDNLTELENLKKEFNGNLQYMATLYAKTKSFKGPNHVYLEVAIKKLKAETITFLLSSGSNVTRAESVYYKEPYYTERMDIIQKLVQFFIKVELLYDNFNWTLQCIIQSISITGKELANSRIN